MDISTIILLVVLFVIFILDRLEKKGEKVSNKNRKPLVGIMVGLIALIIYPVWQLGRWLLA